MCSACCPRSILLADASLSSTGSSGVSSPASTVLSKHYDILLPSRRTSFPSLGDTLVALVVFAPGRTSGRQGLELVTRCLHPAIDQGTNRTLPSSWGTSVIRLHMFQTDAGRTACTRPIQYSNVAPGHHTARAPTIGAFGAQ